MGNKMQTREATTSPILVFGFEQANMQASQTATDLTILGTIMGTYVMPKAGCIVGYGINLTTAVTAGSLAFDLEINGASTLTIDTDTASTVGFYSTIDFGNEPFQAGDLLGVTYTSDGSLAPTTADASVMVYVMFTDFEV